MSFIDTWAATGAGAFTLSENGLYTVEGWKTIIRALRPGGLFCVSRWHSPQKVSESSRLVSLATAALLESGFEQPDQHLILVSLHNVATLLLSNEPFRREDLFDLRQAQKHFWLQILLAPDQPSKYEQLKRIVDSRSLAQIEEAVAHPRYDFTPPTDERPYFFNILKLGNFAFTKVELRVGTTMQGNMMATVTLFILWMVTLVLVVTTILGPLIQSGLPNMKGTSFALAVLYFSLIGMGFMFVQIPLMQRFSVYLGHPTYSVAVILFSMILAAGAGSWLSDRLDIERRRFWVRRVPLAIGVNVFVWTLALQGIINGTIELALFWRIVVSVTVVGLVAFPLGFCFPMGLRLVRRISDDATPWMWGVNGAAGVLASVTAVAVSIWSGISTSLYLGATAYLLLLIPAMTLWRRGA